MQKYQKLKRKINHMKICTKIQEGGYLRGYKLKWSGA
jgi:hypothetical protein